MSGRTTIDPLDPNLGVTAHDAMRVRKGANPFTSPDVLEGLAGDPALVVRVALAMNPNLPAAAIGRLVGDEDERVRAILAGKLAGIAPALSQPDQQRLQRQAAAALARLVEDEAVRVRAAIADVVKDVPNAPRGLILRLARDCAMPVSEPIILFSPVLTDADLLSLIDNPPVAETTAAVARRPDLAARLADVIAAGEDAAAIRALLANKSAQIREATLDALIARAAEHAEWHEPLVQRPELSGRAAEQLAEIVATQFLQILAIRADLAPDVTARLRARLLARLAQDRSLPPDTLNVLSTEEALHQAHRLARSGALNEAAFAEALRTNRLRMAAAMLAVAAVVPISVVDRAIWLRSSRGLVSLLWSAGFGTTVAALAQMVLGSLPPAAVLQPAADGGFGLSVEEMRWQLDFLRRIGA